MLRCACTCFTVRKGLIKQGTQIGSVYQGIRSSQTGARGRTSGVRRFLLIYALIGGLSSLGAIAPLAASQTSDRETKFRLAQALEREGEYERAATLYQDLLKRDPANYVLFDCLQRVWIQLKRYDDVVMLIRNRLTQTPGDLNLRAILGGVLYRAGREKEAAAEWDEAIALAPANPGTYRAVASVLIENRLVDRAAELYRRGRAASGDPHLFTLELAQLLSAGMDYTGAATEYIRWLLQNPTQLAFVQTRIASWSVKPDARSAALSAVQAALDAHEDPLLLELLGWLLMEGKDYDGAFDVYRRIDALSHAGGTALYQFAERAFREKAYAVAARAYQEAITAPLAPQRLPYAELGYARSLKEMSAVSDSLATPVRGTPATESQPLYGGAVARFRAIIDKYPRTEFSAKSYYQIGLIQFEKFADLDGALTSFGHVLEEVTAVNVLRYDVGLMIGRIHIARGDTPRAAERFTAVAAAPDALPDQSDEAVFRLAEIDYFGGRFDGALRQLDGITINLKADYANDALRLHAFLQENVKVAPEALRAFGEADFLARQGKNTEAIAILLGVIATYPQAPLVDEALMTVASLQASAGLYAEAASSYGRLLTQFKESSVSLDRAQFRLGEIFQYGIRDTAKAIAAYEKLLTDYPSSILAAQARSRIRRLRGEAF